MCVCATQARYINGNGHACCPEVWRNCLAPCATRDFRSRALSAPLSTEPRSALHTANNKCLNSSNTLWYCDTRMLFVIWLVGWLIGWLIDLLVTLLIPYGVCAMWIRNLQWRKKRSTWITYWLSTWIGSVDSGVVLSSTWALLVGASRSSFMET